MSLPIDISSFLMFVKSANIPDLSQLTPNEARRYEQLFLDHSPEYGICDIVISQTTLPGFASDLSARIYTNCEAKTDATIVWFHGGGFVLGGVQETDSLCWLISRGLSCRVISVGYHLAPEHPYPTAPEDCYIATQFIVENAEIFEANPKKIGVAGASAGACLAAAVSLMARDRQGPTISHQLLFYPCMDTDFDRASYKKYGKDYFVTRSGMQWFWKNYLGGVDLEHPPAYAAPLNASSFENLPPAFIIGAEYDPLRDEGKDYAEKLRQAKVSVKYECMKGMIHGFAEHALSISSAENALNKIFPAVAKWLG